MNPFMPQSGGATQTASGPVPWMDLLIGVVVVAGLILLYRYLKRRVSRFFVEKRLERDRELRIRFYWRYGYFAFAVLFVVIAFGDSLTAVGLSLALVSTLLAWALQRPIMNLAGWLMLITQRPYGPGDRIIMGGVTGDVKDISISYTELEQVGGTVSGDEKSGRTLLLPNLHLFGWTIVNYTRDEAFILDEVAVRLTHRSDIHRAEAALLRAAREALGDKLRESGAEPYVRHELIPSGVITRLRYKVEPFVRQEVSSQIVRAVFAAVKAEPNVDFCYAHSEVVFESADRAPLMPPPQHPLARPAVVPNR